MSSEPSQFLGGIADGSDKLVGQVRQRQGATDPQHPVDDVDAALVAANLLMHVVYFRGRPGVGAFGDERGQALIADDEDLAKPAPRLELCGFLLRHRPLDLDGPVADVDLDVIRMRDGLAETIS